MTSDAETIKIYDTKASEYAEITVGGMESDPRLKAFIKALPPGGHVLDLGCGPGSSSKLMAQAGLKVTALDASAEMVALAACHAGVTARQATFDELAGDNIYDGVWANFSLLHAPRDALPRHLDALRLALKPNGLLVIAVKTGRGEKRDSLGRLYTYYEEEELTALLVNHGFAPREIVRGRDKGLDGSMADWFSVNADG